MNDTVTIGIVVPANHPALAGHFPGQPVVPAVAWLDAVLAEIRKRGDFVLRSIPAAKFLQPVLPEERVELCLRFAALEAAQMRVSFQCSRATALVFEGSCIVSVDSRA
jgi:3-hydroxymyristoyl/3-hydroxydecanoyl-(acyl carrier protein) dehydratase